MAKKQWTKQKVNPEDINNGNEYDTGDQLSLEALNAIVNNSFYGAEHGGSGGDYTAGNGLKLNEKEFSIDPNVVAQQTDLNKALFSSTTNEEVWLIPVKPTLNYNDWDTTTLTMDFRSGSGNYTQFKILLDHSDDLGLIYDSTRVYTRTFTQDFWLNESYRTIILQEPASGNIKTWLQNIGAVKQGEAGTPNKNTGDVGIIKQKTGDNFYPKTFIDAVYDDNGNPLNNLMPVANPTLTGTEADLNSLTINGTKYKIPSGGGSGGDYIAGTGINITDKTISADTNILATKEDIPTGETDITFNGTPTTTSEDLENVVIGDKTYIVPSNTQVNSMKVDINELKLGKQNTLKANDITTELIADHAVTESKLPTSTVNMINNSLQIPVTAPTETELVGIGINKSQMNIGIGDGLGLENGKLKATGGKTLYYNLIEFVDNTNPSALLTISIKFISSKNIYTLDEFLIFLQNKERIPFQGSCSNNAGNTYVIIEMGATDTECEINYIQAEALTTITITKNNILNFSSTFTEV